MLRLYAVMVDVPAFVSAGHTQPSTGSFATFHRFSSIGRTRMLRGSPQRARFSLIGDRASGERTIYVRTIYVRKSGVRASGVPAGGREDERRAGDSYANCVRQRSEDNYGASKSSA